MTHMIRCWAVNFNKASIPGAQGLPTAMLLEVAKKWLNDNISGEVLYWIGDDKIAAIRDNKVIVYKQAGIDFSPLERPVEVEATLIP